MKKIKVGQQWLDGTGCVVEILSTDGYNDTWSVLGSGGRTYTRKGIGSAGLVPSEMDLVLIITQETHPEYFL